jgi:hypothetical protein
VRLDRASYAVASTDPGVVALVPYHPAFKLAPTIGLVPLPDGEKAVSGTYEIDASLFPDEDPREVARAIASVGGHVLSTTSTLIELQIDKNRLAALAALEPIAQLFEHAPIYPKGGKRRRSWRPEVGRRSAAVRRCGDHWRRGLGTCSAPLPQFLPGVSIAPVQRLVLGRRAAQILMVLDNGFQLDAGVSRMRS